MSSYVQLDVWFQEDKLSALSSVLVEQGERSRHIQTLRRGGGYGHLVGTAQPADAALIKKPVPDPVHDLQVKVGGVHCPQCGGETSSGMWCGNCWRICLSTPTGGTGRTTALISPVMRRIGRWYA